MYTLDDEEKKDLEKAEKNLQDFLDNNPEAMEQQKEIKRILNATAPNTPEKRMEVIAMMLIESSARVGDKTMDIADEAKKRGL